MVGERSKIWQEEKTLERRNTESGTPFYQDHSELISRGL
jgi:hypothetical protein